MNDKYKGVAIIGVGYVGHLGRTTVAPTQIGGLVGTDEVVVVNTDETTTLSRTFEIPVVPTVQLSGQEKRRQRRKNNRKK